VRDAAGEKRLNADLPLDAAGAGDGDFPLPVTEVPGERALRGELRFRGSGSSSEEQIDTADRERPGPGRSSDGKSWGCLVADLGETRGDDGRRVLRRRVAEEDAVRVAPVGLGPGGKEAVAGGRQPLIVADEVFPETDRRLLEVERRVGKPVLLMPAGGVGQSV